MTSRSFADDLRSRTDAQLRRLLMLRPDLALPEPADVTGLAARAATRASVIRAVDGLTADLLRTLEAVLVAGAAGAADLLGVSASKLRTPLSALWDRALLWDSPNGLTPARAVGEYLVRPAQLGPDIAAPHAPADPVATRATLEEETRRVLDSLTWQHPRVRLEGAVAEHALPALLTAGFLVREDAETVVLPRTVALSLRGGRLYAEGLRAPEPTGAQVDPVDVDATAGMAGYQLLWLVEALARHWETDPPRTLRGGGVSVRDHKHAARVLDLDLDQTAFIIETASAAGLFATDGHVDPMWRPTSVYDEWLEQRPAQRLAALVEAWWTTMRAPSLVGHRDESGTLVNLLSQEATWPLMRQRRHEVLTALSGLAPDLAPDAASLDALLRWERPLRLPAGSPTRAAEVLRESAWVGATARGAATSVGRALVAGELSAATVHQLLPRLVDHLLVQADLTAIAPGPLEDEARRLMDLAADVESRGGATVFRFTEASLRRAMDYGLEASDLTARLTSLASTPLPQPLVFLLDDVARRYGRTRVGSVNCYLRSDDPATLAALVNDRYMAAYQLRQIAPTVAVSRLSAAQLLEALNAAGHPVVAETSDGGVVLRERRPERSPAPRPTAAVSTRRVGEADADALVGRLRDHEREAAGREGDRVGPRIPSTDPTVTVTALQDAAAERVPVWIGYVDGAGDIRRALFFPDRVDGGRAVGTVGDSTARQTFSVHRITGVAPAG